MPTDGGCWAYLGCTRTMTDSGHEPDMQAASDVRQARRPEAPPSAALGASGVPENGLSQGPALGITPGNPASPVAAAAGLTPENKELLASYSDQDP